MTSISTHIRSNLVGTIALFVALCGTAYAGGTVGSGDVIDDSLKSVDLKDGAAVTSADVVDGSLTAADIQQSTLAKVPDTNAVGGLTISDLIFTDGNPGFDGDFGGTFKDLFLVDANELNQQGVASGAIKDSALGRADQSNGAAGAYGSVTKAGDVFRASRVVSVTNPDNGVFCITAELGINPSERGVIASPNFATDSSSTSFDKTTTVEWDSARLGGCPSGTFEVDTFVQSPLEGLNGDVVDSTTNTQSNESFFFIIP